MPRHMLRLAVLVLMLGVVTGVAIAQYGPPSPAPPPPNQPPTLPNPPQPSQPSPPTSAPADYTTLIVVGALVVIAALVAIVAVTRRGRTRTAATR